MPIIDAREDFARARRAARLARAARWLGRHHRHDAPRALDHRDWLPRGTPRLRLIPLAEIVGTVEPTKSFDARFRPVTELVRPRWAQIALAYRRGLTLPPIDVLERPDGYYVVDGRHRVSVARALGHRHIDAWVTCVRDGRVERPKAPTRHVIGHRNQPECPNRRQKRADLSTDSTGSAVRSR
jgi:hypothetical protein